MHQTTVSEQLRLGSDALKEYWTAKYMNVNKTSTCSGMQVCFYKIYKITKILQNTHELFIIHINCVFPFNFYANWTNFIVMTVFNINWPCK